MTQEKNITIQEWLEDIKPFNQLPAFALDRLCKNSEMLRYRMGQQIIIRNKMPAFVSIIYEGRARLLGYNPQSNMPVTLQKLDTGSVIGLSSVVRGINCETAIAAEDSICINIPVENFVKCLESETAFAKSIKNIPYLSEIYELLSLELGKQPKLNIDLQELASDFYQRAEVLNLHPGEKVKTLKSTLTSSDNKVIWFVSSGNIGEFSTGHRITNHQSLKANDKQPARLLALPDYSQLIQNQNQQSTTENYGIENHEIQNHESWNDKTQNNRENIRKNIEYAPEFPPEAKVDSRKYPYIHGKGVIDAPMACFQMISKHLGVTFRRDVLRKILVNQQKSTGNINLGVCGAIVEMMGVNAQLINMPASSIHRIRPPALINYLDSIALIYHATADEIVVAIPEMGVRHLSASKFTANLRELEQVLLLQPSNKTVREKFSLRWFIPVVYRYRKVLIEVLIASFFVQLFVLANPLVTQVIIDKVIIQGGRDSLNILGIFLLGVALFEAILTGVRTYLFVDTTNRIDLSLGSEVIEHLLRLPLKYFDHRRVGELAGRINELENIRQFLTGTALTVVLDAIFSVIYIGVMIFYSWLLTIVALATVPLFALLTIFVSPIVRRQLNTKAERYADTQSYLVEVVSGIQTVKAQNLELKSRWQWYERYAKYIGAGFQTVATSTTASAISGFLNKFSGLLLLWVGASLVLSNQLTLGQLIAFRIIAGYVTSPLLRLIQLWQNFQETALSIERLGDILDTPAEIDDTNRHQLPMPEIEGQVKFENISFSFTNQGALQLSNINLEFTLGSFVGIVGQSGSGKSTLTKLLQRLYEPTSGRILIDGYDINKVELYSLRRQIGTVLQDTLLFSGTVQENIALTNPEASAEEIINAAKIAVAHDFIMALPNGYNTIVGERGSSLSGGQRQRIAIARTVLQSPQLLILDEATSALDYHSERSCCDNLAQAFVGRTVFFITHRLSTVKNADVILMMDKGAVVEQGTHQELMSLKGLYYCLYQQQESQL
jgi:ATP-binding cassette, subfamily B, bacterial HlyB/CyaB